MVAHELAQRFEGLSLSLVFLNQLDDVLNYEGLSKHFQEVRIFGQSVEKLQEVHALDEEVLEQRKLIQILQFEFL